MNNFPQINRANFMEMPVMWKIKDFPHYFGKPYGFTTFPQKTYLGIINLLKFNKKKCQLLTRTRHFRGLEREKE
jgi:hypothetical protein